MPEFIESVYVHRPVREADIPRRGALSQRARGKGKRSRKAAASPATPATMTQAPPPALWSMAAREPLFRPVPPERKGRFDNVNLTPIGMTVFFVWIAVCCVFKILG
ncbi:MAG TPA: hypothetical protein VK980_10445 [Sphingomonas sp.]|nr:hypothetical protein [Sphingomonas sp.]